MLITSLGQIPVITCLLPRIYCKGNIPITQLWQKHAFLKLITLLEKIPLPKKTCISPSMHYKGNSLITQLLQKRVFLMLAQLVYP